MTNERASANKEVLQPRTAPGGTYQFYSETDADLSSREGRIEWFCAHFDVKPPVLEYDKDKPDQIVMTDDLLKWIRLEGMSIDWMISGHVTGALAAFREKHREWPENVEFVEMLTGFNDTEKAMLSAAIRLVKRLDLDFETVMNAAFADIRENREQMH